MIELNIDENFELVIRDKSFLTNGSIISGDRTYLKRLIERNEIVRKTDIFEKVLDVNLYEGRSETEIEDLIKENLYIHYEYQYPEIREKLKIEVVYMANELMIFYMDEDDEFILDKKYTKYYSNGGAV